MTTFWNTHNNFHGGIFPDVPGALIPEGGVYDALDLLLDQPGKFRKRGGTVATGTQTAKLVDLLAFRSGNPNVTDKIVGLSGTGASGNTPNFNVVNPSTGAFTAITLDGPSSSPDAAYSLGKLFMHLGFMFAPIQCRGDAEYNWLMVYGGAAGTKTSVYTPVAAADVVAGSATITVSAANFAANTEVGEIVFVAGSNNFYVGRIVAVGTTVIDVEPTPTLSFTGDASGLSVHPSLICQDSSTYYGGDTAVSHQNRIVIGGLTAALAAGTHAPRRIIWTSLPGETVTANSGLHIDGLVAALRSSVQPNNYDEVSAAEPIKSLRSVGTSELAVFSANTMYRVTGDLQTETIATTNPNTWQVDPISQSLGTLSGKSCIQTPAGLVFATALGVYFYDTHQLTPLMEERMAKAYQDLLRGGATIHGAMLVRNHYLLCMSTGAYLCNLDDIKRPTWTRISNIDLFGGTQDHTDPAKYWGCRWWDTSTSAPSQTGGQMIRVDSIFAPTSSNKTDADTTAVTSSLITRAYLEGDPELLKRFTRAMYEYNLKGPGVVTALIDANLEPSDATFVTVGALPPNLPITVTAATNASPIAITSAAHGYATGDKVTIRGVGGNTNANGSWFITVTGINTFTLNSSSGNAAYTSGGTASQPFVKQFHTTPLLPRTLAVVHKITQTVGTDRFEILGIKHGFQPLRQGRAS